MGMDWEMLVIALYATQKMGQLITLAIAAIKDDELIQQREGGAYTKVPSGAVSSMQTQGDGGAAKGVNEDGLSPLPKPSQSPTIQQGGTIEQGSLPNAEDAMPGLEQSAAEADSANRAATPQAKGTNPLIVWIAVKGTMHLSIPVVEKGKV